MENIEALKLINRVQKDLIGKGIVIDKLIIDFKKLRAYFIEEEMPRVVKILRLAYEHLENYQTFDIPMPVDEDEDEEKEEISVDQQRIESLDYLISLFKNPTQKMNAEDLNYYMKAFQAYAEQY
ncbi:MAG: hypothetical protein JEZ09_01740 [Salinivirgaceae bacterium]|nr:hypothetical protein [Salinivirgaceae bacterium]